MCGRYYIPDEEDIAEYKKILQEILEKLKKSKNVKAMKTSGEVFPSDIVPVIANNKDMKPSPFAMQWGYSLSGNKKVINARSETSSEKPMFKNGMLKRRCLIPAAHYFEWQKTEGCKVKHAIWLTGK